MAGRIRSIKPETLDDEAACALSDAAWRLWVSCWLLADDYGNARAGLKYLAALVWQDTKRAEQVPALLAELGAAKRLTLYQDDNGQPLLHVNNWEKHQRIDNAGKPRVALMLNQLVSDKFAEFRRTTPRTAETLRKSPPDLRPPTSDPDRDLPACARDPSTTDHVPPALSQAALEALWVDVLKKMPGDRHRFDALCERLSRDAALQQRTPADLCRDMIAALSAFRQWCSQNGWHEPPLSVAGFERNYERLLEWVQGRKPVPKQNTGGPKHEPTRPQPPPVRAVVKQPENPVPPTPEALAALRSLRGEP